MDEGEKLWAATREHLAGLEGRVMTELKHIQEGQERIDEGQERIDARFASFQTQVDAVRGEVSDIKGRVFVLEQAKKVQHQQKDAIQGQVDEDRVRRAEARGFWALIIAAAATLASILHDVLHFKF